MRHTLVLGKLRLCTTLWILLKSGVILTLNININDYWYWIDSNILILDIKSSVHIHNSTWKMSLRDYINYRFVIWFWPAVPSHSDSCTTVCKPNAQTPLRLLCCSYSLLQDPIIIANMTSSLLFHSEFTFSLLIVKNGSFPGVIWLSCFQIVSRDIQMKNWQIESFKQPIQKGLGGWKLVFNWTWISVSCQNWRKSGECHRLSPDQWWWLSALHKPCSLGEVVLSG